MPINASSHVSLFTGTLDKTHDQKILLGGKSFASMLEAQQILDQEVELHINVVDDEESLFQRSLTVAGPIKVSGTGHVCVGKTVLSDLLDCFWSSEVAILIH